jgi:predicted CoA-binding protein
MPGVTGQPAVRGFTDYWQPLPFLPQRRQIMKTYPEKPEDHVVVVLGASPKPTRYSNMAVRQLKAKGYRVIPVHPKADTIGDLPVVHGLGGIEGKVHTLTLYLGPLHSRGQLDDILALAPKRVIFNPGTESPELEARLRSHQIECIRGCTLVMLRSGLF